MNNDYSKIVQVIPTYNEKENIPTLISVIGEKMPNSPILIVDDNSPDGTHSIVSNLAKNNSNLFLLKRENNKGFGRSYIDGFKKIMANPEHEIIVMMDADFSHDPAAIPKMVEKLDDHDLVIGSRYTDGGSIENWRLKRRILSRFANFYARTILGLPIGDVTTGFMCFRKSVLDKINLDLIKSDGYAFLVELKYQMFKNGCRMAEYPIIFRERREGQSKMSAKIIWESIWLPWKIKFQRKTI